MGNVVQVLTNNTYNISLFSQESPPLSRNAPMVSGAISWARGLLRKIEEPMKIFKENKFITSLRVFAIFVVPVFPPFLVLSIFQSSILRLHKLKQY